MGYYCSLDLNVSSFCFEIAIALSLSSCICFFYSLELSAEAALSTASYRNFSKIARKRFRSMKFPIKTAVTKKNIARYYFDSWLSTTISIISFQFSPVRTQNIVMSASVVVLNTYLVSSPSSSYIIPQKNCLPISE